MDTPIFANSKNGNETHNNYIRLFFNDEPDKNKLDKGIPCIAYKYGKSEEVIKRLSDLLQ